MRKDYIDNLRTICIFLLFPFHTFMMYNNWGEGYYLHIAAVDSVSFFNILINPWWMTLLFTLAGVSSAYALSKRSCRQYIDERLLKLMRPLLVALILLIPVQSYIADCVFNGYEGGYFAHYSVFFTRFTDLTGYDGGFTPGHLWFMLYLFIVSMLMLPLMNWYSKRTKKIDGSKISVVMLLPYFLVILLMTPILEFGGKSIGEALACFAAGYFLLSLDEVQDKLSKSAWWLTGLFIVSTIARFILQEELGPEHIISEIERRMVTWFGILSMFALAKRYLNSRSTLSRYLAGASFPLYYFHQSYLVVIAYFVTRNVSSLPLQMILIILGSFVASLASYEVFRRIKLTAALFGIKYKGEAGTLPSTGAHS